MSEVITVKETARRLLVSELTIRRMIKTGELSANKTSPRRIGVMVDSINKYMQSTAPRA